MSKNIVGPMANTRIELGCRENVLSGNENYWSPSKKSVFDSDFLIGYPIRWTIILM
ncbi:3101_t:CDS:2 [Rhizophagus irregularis]|nr:3101_t:CDS:2 [Rhizophagus irregularis]